MQHAWATTVETVGILIQQSLKSSQGVEKWLRFFVIMRSAMAIMEGEPIVYGTSENYNKLREEISEISRELDVEGHLTSFTKSIEIISDKKWLTLINTYWN